MSNSSLLERTLSRRRFLAIAGLAPTFVLATSALRGATTATSSPVKTSSKKVPIGLELYSVRTELARDVRSTLQQVAGVGYQVVEFYAPYFDWTPARAKEVRAMMDDLGLRCHSTHNHFETFATRGGLAKAIELNGALGAQQLILATAPTGTTTAEDWKKLAGELSVATGQLRSHGLTAGFHNHQTEWLRLPEGMRVMDIVAEYTPPEFVLQLDVGTCVEAGADPVAWIRSHPGRVRSLHLKDWAPGREADEKGYRVLFGEGVAPWAAICEAAESVGGVEVYLLEQEGSRFSEMETAKRCLESWKKFRGES